MCLVYKTAQSTRHRIIWSHMNLGRSYESLTFHYDIITWKYFPITGPFWGKTTGGLPSRTASNVDLSFLMLVWTTCWTNSRYDNGTMKHSLMWRPCNAQPGVASWVVIIITLLMTLVFIGSYIIVIFADVLASNGHWVMYNHQYWLDGDCCVTYESFIISSNFHRTKSDRELVVIDGFVVNVYIQCIFLSTALT